MSVHKHNSWGRTRSPKNIAGDPGTAVTLESSTTPLLSGTTGYKLKGYSTQNQRYLHVLVTDANSAEPAAVTVFGYCHAFQRWFELPQSFDPVATNAGPTAASITVADSGLAATAQAPNDTEYRVYEIVGVDRVAFVGADANVDVYAACSTF